MARIYSYIDREGVGLVRVDGSVYTGEVNSVLMPTDQRLGHLRYIMVDRSFDTFIPW